MRSLKKLITVVLALAMMLTSVGIPAFAASFSDITDEKVADAVDKLVAYGIITGYEDGTFKPDNQITRAEFAAIVTRMKGVADSLGTDAVTGFSDLDNDDSRAWARPYVKAAVDLKIINGFEDGTFRAAEPVTYEQAVKMLVCAVGYEVVAQSEYNKAIVSNPNATWSAGYITAANKHGITKGVITAQISEPAVRGVVAVLTSNALEVPALVPDENGNLTKPEDGEGMSESNMQTIEGTVIGTYYTGISEASTGLDENEINIKTSDDEEDGVYTLSEDVLASLDLDQYIGRKVKAYYDNIEGEITKISLVSSNTTIIEDTSVRSIEDNQIRYRNSAGNLLTENLSGRNLIVNGNYVESYDFDEFRNGTIELFTAAGKKIAKVTSYDVFVVNSFDRNNNKIYLKYENYGEDNYYEFPARTSDKPIIYVKSGTGSYVQTEYSKLSLSRYDIINYVESLESADGNVYRKMYVTKGSKSGKVTEGSDTGREVEIDGKTMYLTQQYYTFEGTTNDAKAPFELSDTYTYYVDYFGQIAAVNYDPSASSGSWEYGYLTYVDKESSKVRLIDKSGNTKTYELKDSVKVDNEKVKARSAFDVLETSAEEIDGNAIEDVTLTRTNGFAQPLRYSVSGGKIDAIDTVLGDYDNPTSNDKFTYDGRLAGSEGGNTTTTKVTVDGVSYGVNSSTIILYVPKNRSDDSYAVMKASDAFSISTSRYVEVFAVDTNSSNNLAGMVLVYGMNPLHNFTGASPYMIVTDIRNSGDTRKITGYVSGGASTTEVSVSEDNFVTDINDTENLVSGEDVEVGDLIRYIKDNNGEMIAIQMVYDASEGGDTLEDGENLIEETLGSGTDFYAAIGVVESKDTTDSRITIAADTSRTYKYSSSKIYKFTTDDEVIDTVIENVYDGTEGIEESKVIIISKNKTEATAATVIYVIE